MWKRFRNTSYLISDEGDVYSEKNKKILKQIDDGHGYMTVSIWIDGESSKEKVHRLVAITFLGEPEGKLTVNHKNGIKTDNRLENLEWLSLSDNMIHAWTNGLMKFGSQAPVAKLNEALVEDIKMMMLEGLSNQEIANRCNVVRGSISKIRDGKTWKHVRPDLTLPKSPIGKYSKRSLTAEDIPVIRKLYEEGISLAEIGRTFKVHSGTIDGIVKGKTWKNY